MTRVDAPTLKRWIADGGELAILDAREEGEFGRAHLFWANNVPLSRAEWRLSALLPRRGVRICCVDGGEGHAERLAELLDGLGCGDVAVLEGGTPAWAAAGYELFSGVNVPSKAFGEWVEHHYATPSIDAAQLHALQADGTDMVVLDSRPMDEFCRMSIPGGVCVPGGELVYRIDALVPRPETLVVVNCAGRTRSILGAESLRSAGLPNRVVALRNGTMGWELAGLAPARGETAGYTPGTPAALATAQARAEQFAARQGVRSIDHAGLARLRADPGRTTLLLDVRDPAEFHAGHVPGSLSAPGGQLVQATDRWVAVRGARLVLIDDNLVRARMAAGWLRQMAAGWDVFVLEDALGGRLDTAVPRPAPGTAAAPVRSVKAHDLNDWRTHGDTVVVQLSRSVDFRAEHIPQALWGVRTRLRSLAPHLSGARRIVLAAESEDFAVRAVDELRAIAPGASVFVLADGLPAWRAAGLPLSADRHNPPDADCIDTYLRPYDRNDGVKAAMRDYLSWEIDLVHAVARDGDADFRTP